MRYIVLVGKDQTGKTTSINALAKKFVVNGATVVDEKAGHKFNTYVSSSVQLAGKKKDDDLTIVVSFCGKLIGITTFGDARACIAPKVDFFRNIGCTHAIFASHPSGSSYEYLVGLAKADAFKDIHAVFKIGCAGIVATPALIAASDNHAVIELFHWII